MTTFLGIDPWIFLASLIIGLLYSYWKAPVSVPVIKYPTPFNTRDTIYRDENGICYKYKIKEVSCPADKSNITQLAIGTRDSHVM